VHPTDHELMRLTAEGDGEAFAVLVRRWERRVIRVLAPLTQSAEDAEDLRQEAFLRVLTASERYRPCGEFSTWLFRIVLNLARDHARRRKRRPPLKWGDPPDEHAGPTAVDASRRELAEAVAASLDALPEELREIVVLKHYAQMSFAEMAEVLETPASTLKSRMAAALGRLRAELARRGVRDAGVER
jgi:RNA polymerase sigma-70 factor (ECF subfamily)